VSHPVWVRTREPARRNSTVEAKPETNRFPPVAEQQMAAHSGAHALLSSRPNCRICSLTQPAMR
jgi:hypothetical protein